MTLLKKIFDQIEQNIPLIAVESPLQERPKLLHTLTSECAKRNINLYLWMLEDDQLQQFMIEGERLVWFPVGEYKAISAKNRPEHYFEILRFWKTTNLQGVLVLEGIFPWLGQGSSNPDFFLTSEWLKSALLNIKLDNSNSRKTTILLGPNTSLSSDLAAEIPTIIQQLPTPEEINAYLLELQRANYTQARIDEIANICVGMHLADIQIGISQFQFLTQADSTTNIDLASYLSAYKIDLLKRIYNIEFLQPPAIAVGGLELMQSTFEKYKRLLTPLAKSYNLRIPKGVLLIGPPGTGKSFSAKACAQILRFPLVIVEWGNFRSYGNMAEYHLKKLLALVDRINRIVFYLDDFDKGFAGDDDLSRRLAGILLTWMQERTSEVLVIASANNVQWLPPELTRSGRFDDIFKVDLPNYGERHEIFKIHLARYDHRFCNGGDAYSTEQWQKLLKATQRCVGAEIQAIVEKAAINTFCHMFGEDDNSLIEEGTLPRLEITPTALLESRKNINPLAIRQAEQIESMRNKANLQGLPSSGADTSIYSVSNIDIFA